MAMYPTIGPTTPYDTVRTISAEALLQEVRSDVGLTILDVRDRAETRATGTLAGAWAIPLYQLTSRLDELVHLRATPVVLVSRRSRRARAAARLLELASFGEVFVLEGGIERWTALGYPVVDRHESTPP
jgi:rhodanese-related sulfurtransferase